jgi:hypothetical protein
VAAMVQSPLAIGVQAGVVVASATVVERHVDRRSGLLAAASRANAVAWRGALGVNPRFQGVVARHVPHPVTPRQAAERPWLPGGLRAIDAPHRGRLPGVIRTAVVAPLGTLVGRGHPGPVAPWRLPATVDLGDPPDRYPHLGVTAEEPVGQVPYGLPARRRGRLADPHAQGLDAPCRGGPLALGPIRGRSATVWRGLGRPSRADRGYQGLAGVSSDATGGTSAPLPVGSLHRPWWPSPADDRMAFAAAHRLSPLGMGQLDRQWRQWPDHLWG